MKHVSGEEMVLLYYGDSEHRAVAEAHLAGCEACRREFALLRSTLDAVEGPAVPEPHPGYEQEVWSRLEPVLPVRQRRRWFPVAWLNPRLWATAASVAGLVVAAFFAGHWVSEQRHKTEVARSAPGTVQRILVVAVSNHLDRSQMVLSEIANTEPAAAQVDFSEERKWAQDLLGENRLYRQTAKRSGIAGVANLLDDLERVLVEIANSPDTVSPEEWNAMRNRIESDGILFKVRVIGSRLKSQQAQPARPKQIL